VSWHQKGKTSLDLLACQYKTMMMLFGVFLQNCALQYSALLEKVETPRCVVVMCAVSVNIFYSTVLNILPTSSESCYKN